jgi:hypothetical protein
MPASQAKELYGHPAQKDSGAGKGMGVTLEPGEGQKTGAQFRNEHCCNHGGNRYPAKDTGDQHNAEQTILGRRVHDKGDERFAWAKDEDGKQDPGRDVRFAFSLMNMDVVLCVDVFVQVDIAVTVQVGMFVGSVS